MYLMKCLGVLLVGSEIVFFGLESIYFKNCIVVSWFSVGKLLMMIEGIFSRGG